LTTLNASPRTFAPKLVLVGNSGVGKTAIGRRFVTNSFHEGYNTTVLADSIRKQMNINGSVVDLRIWDTAGQEVYRALNPLYFRDASLAIIVFSVIDSKSLECAEYWINSVRQVTPTALLALAGNKVDLSPRVIKFESANEFAKKHKIPYVETSAMTGEGVASLFENLVERYLEGQAWRLSTAPEEPKPSVLLSATVEEQKSSKCCC
jgi:Rab family protein